jgi:hypothetical protein
MQLRDAALPDPDVRARGPDRGGSVTLEIGVRDRSVAAQVAKLRRLCLRETGQVLVDSRSVLNAS